MSFLKVEKLCLCYGEDTPENRVLEDINISINEGEFVAIVGPSGCGKSTFMKLLSGLLKPLNGCMFMNDELINSPRANVGMAFQNSIMLPWRTTLQNLLLPLEVSPSTKKTFKKRKLEYIERAKQLLATVGLAGMEEKYPWELSGGMRQRASLCRALIHKPSLLLLDEPFGALDAFTKEELWCVLRDLWQQEKFTVVLVTHDLTEAVFLADKVLVMSARPGQIIKEAEIDFERPRDLEIRYKSKFVDTVHELRDQIKSARHSLLNKDAA